MCLGVPGRIETIQGDDPLTRTGHVSFGGVQREVNLSFTPEAELGNYVIVHVGFSISIVDEEEAQRVFSYLKELGDDAVSR